MRRWVSSRLRARQSGVVTQRWCAVVARCAQAPLPRSLPLRTLPPPVPLAEALDAAGGVEDALVPGPERVRGRGDVHDHQRVGLAVAPLDGLLARHGRAGLVGVPAGSVAEDDLAVLGVDALAHTSTLPTPAPGTQTAGRALRHARSSGEGAGLGEPGRRDRLQ